MPSLSPSLLTSTAYLHLFADFTTNGGVQAIKAGPPPPAANSEDLLETAAQTLLNLTEQDKAQKAS